MQVTVHQHVFFILRFVMSSQMFSVGAISTGGAYPADAGHPMQTQSLTLLNGSGLPFSSVEPVNQVACLIVRLVCFSVPSFILGFAFPRCHVDMVCPLVDLILQTTDTASLGMSSRITDPPMGLLTHLQSHSRELIEPGVGNNKSVICESKI